MIPSVEGLAAFGPAAVAACLLAGYLVVGEPAVGTVLHRRFEAALARDPDARTWLYQRLLVLEWGLVVLVAGVLWLAPSVGAGEIGLRLPEQAPNPVAVVLAVLVVAFLVVSTKAVRASVRRSADMTALTAAAPRAITSLVPRSPTERRWFGLVAVTAGFCEELLYRGFLLAVVLAIAPGIPDLALVALGAVTFGLAHFYQGLGGVVATTVLGAILTFLYVGTGTVLVPMVVHAAIDLRILWLPVGMLPAEGRDG
ncbi:MAG: CPBP family intramembrane metalloprotease [Geodermatophilaceae bacterium]|nr:CPBP family intramembrane metalloprotease [Geodermatophilaceae bacterium]